MEEARLQGPTLFGRDAEIASVRAALGRVVAGRGALLLVAGEAGIGKTSLADVFSAEAECSGVAVAWGRCWEAGGTPAYWPWTQVFRALGIDDPLGAATDAGAAEARDVRFRVFDRAAEAMRAAALARPIAVVLDDLHAADVPSLLFLHLLARNLRSGGRLGILATYREAEARTGETGALLTKIAREGELFLPARLTPPDVANVVRAQQPDASDAAVAQVYAVSEGNPLFVHELLRARASLDAGSLPDGLRAAIGEHLGRVSEGARALLEAASVLGRDWTEADAVALAGHHAAGAFAKIAEARGAGLVVAPLAASASESARFAFAHILIRERLYGELAPARRAELHARAGERFAASGNLAAAAHHLLESGAKERAAAVSLEAARAALHKLAFEDAARLASRGLQVAPPSSELSCELEITVAESLIRTGDSTSGKQACLRAAAAAARLGLPRTLARVALGYGASFGSGLVDATMVDLLREALAALPEEDDPLRARVLARLAEALSPPSSRADMVEITGVARAAVAMARRVADEDTMLFVLRYAGSSQAYLTSPDERFALARETMGLAARLHRPIVLLERGPWWVALLRERGLGAEAEAALDAHVSLLREFQQPHYRWRPPLLLACHAMLDGDFERADRLAAEGLALAEEGAVFDGRVSWMMHRLSRALLLDSPHLLAPDADRIQRIVAPLETMAPWGGTLEALVLAALGRKEEARRRVSTLTVEVQDRPGVLMFGHLPLLLGDRAMAERLLSAFTDTRDRIPFFWVAHGSAVFGPAARVAGELAAMLGRDDEARALMDEAVSAAERVGSPPLIELTRARREALERGAPKHARLATPNKPSAPTERPEIRVARDGDVWTVRWSSGGQAVLKDTKGLHYLAELVRNPGRELHVTQIADLLEPAGDAGPVLDGKAKDAYRQRLEDLRDALEEARQFGDAARAERAEAEIDALAEQLAGAVGLGGRDRKAGSHVERARINVQRRIKDVLRRIEEQEPDLGRYLAASIKTGTWCSFEPV